MTQLVEIGGLTFELLGSVFIVYTVVKVHHRMQMEHKIDEAVYAEMNRERKAALIGVAMIITGYLMQVFALLQ